MYKLIINNTYSYDVFNFTESFQKGSSSSILTVASRGKSGEVKALMSLSELVEDVNKEQTLNLKIFFEDNLILETNNYVLETATITSQIYYTFEQDADEPAYCDDIVTVDMEFKLNIPETISTEENDNNEEEFMQGQL